MSSYDPERLETIMREESNPGLFSAEVCWAYAAGPDGPPKARALLARELISDPAQKAARMRWFKKKWLWAAPVHEPPHVALTAGTGTGFGGDLETGPDGTAVANRWVKVLGVPVFPLGAYWIRRGTPPDVLGKVPLDTQWYGVPAVFLWLATMPLALLYANAVDSSFERGGSFYVVNGFDRPIRVIVGDKEGTVAPGGKGYLSTETPGPHDVRTYLGSVPVETRTLDVPENYVSDDILLYNPTGRAVLLQAWNRYGDGPEPPRPKLLVGPEITTDRPDDFFVEPSELVFSKEDAPVRIHLSMLWASASPEERAATLLSKGYDQEAGVYGRALVASGEDHPTLLAAALTGGDRDALCSAWTTAMPESPSVADACSGAVSE